MRQRVNCSPRTCHYKLLQNHLVPVYSLYVRKLNTAGNNVHVRCLFWIIDADTKKKLRRKNKYFHAAFRSYKLTLLWYLLIYWYTVGLKNANSWLIWNQSNDRKPQYLGVEIYGSGHLGQYHQWQLPKYDSLFFGRNKLAARPLKNPLFLWKMYEPFEICFRISALVLPLVFGVTRGRFNSFPSDT